MFSVCAVLTTALIGAGSVHHDGRDHRNLLTKRLVNRDLAAQLAPWRLGDEFAPFAIAADIQIGTQYPLVAAGPTPFHGFFVSDVFLEVAIFDGLAVNLNLTMLNVTASGGFRVLSDVLPGLAVSLHLPTFELAGETVFVDFVGPDLDIVTLGEGALVQDIFLEGFMAGLRRGSTELHVTFGGRVFWPQDDLLHFALDFFDRRLGLTYTRWFVEYPDGEIEGTSFFSGEIPDANFFSVHGRIEPVPGLVGAAEYVLRAGGPSLASSILARLDATHRSAKWALHAGYQFRWYEGGFGPWDELQTPSTLVGLPVVENTYATQSFPFLWATSAFEQWTHALVAEAQYRWDDMEGYVELEGWVRAAKARNLARPLLVRSPDGRRLPGLDVGGFYTAGLRWRPLDGLPHFLSLFVSNKSVFAYGSLNYAVPTRFVDQPGLFIEGELRL